MRPWLFSAKDRGHAYFLERRQHEVRRISIPRTRLDKVPARRRGVAGSRAFCVSSGLLAHSMRCSAHPHTRVQRLWAGYGRHEGSRAVSLRGGRYRRAPPRRVVYCVEIMDLARFFARKRRSALSDRPIGEPQKSTFRPDIEGLRAVAVGVVLLYHAGVPFATGGYVGVDVFFVISGFLITGLLVRELEKTDGISLSRFYSRRAKRLLPLTMVVLAFVVLVALALPLYDPVRMDELSLGVIACALYVMNWLLAARATDYFAAGLQASPVQHFWTLAVEEQFYLIWPTLLLAGAWLGRRAGRGLRDRC
jgi:hypothetical protein